MWENFPRYPTSQNTIIRHNTHKNMLHHTTEHFTPRHMSTHRAPHHNTAQHHAQQILQTANKHRTNDNTNKPNPRTSDRAPAPKPNTASGSVSDDNKVYVCYCCRSIVPWLSLCSFYIGLLKVKVFNVYVTNLIWTGKLMSKMEAICCSSHTPKYPSGLTGKVK